ncbi:MAG: hypothetical protein NZ920_05570 [Aigarchaeota archaeon]|nr:hypothetical protein [Aigarchaeota archaeon]MDW8092839.1 STT3 domain-containing protein [Nitrososphaerota archaeon]
MLTSRLRRVPEVLKLIEGGGVIRRTTLEIGLLLLILTLAFVIRSLPARWGVMLTEFDPWWHFRVASFVISHGWGGFFEFADWVEPKSWYPTGLNAGSTFYPGVGFTMAFIYLLLSSIGIRVEPLELAAVLPVVYGVITVLVVFLFSRYAFGGRAAIASALLITISSAHIQRTHYGWFDDESLSIPLMLAGYLTFLLAIREENSFRRSVLLGLLSGGLLGYMGASWGAHRFPIAFLPFFAFLLLVLGRYRTNLLYAYAPMVVTYSLILVNVPKLGLGYLNELSISVGLFVLGFLIVTELLRRRFDIERATVYVRGLAIVFILGILAVIMGGVIGLPGLKFLSVLLPWARGDLAIVISVAENQVSVWASIFQDFGPMIVLVPYGIYMMVKRGRDIDIFIAAYTLFAVYFAASMVRLVLLTSPAVAMVAGFTISEMLSIGSRSLSRIKGRPFVFNPPRSLIIVPLIILIALALYYQPVGVGGRVGLSPIDAASLPPTLATSTIPIRQILPDWIKAVSWMRDNLPSNAVVAAWWDYGNWISIVGNKTSLIDNTTIDSKRIARVAYAFMSPENESYRVFRGMGATHVLIFVTHGVLTQGEPPRLLGFGEESKWVWMLQIANQESEYLGIKKIDEGRLLGPQGDPTNPTEEFWRSTTLGLLIPYKPQVVNQQNAFLYQESSLRHYRLVFSSSPPYGSFAYVYIYEIID